jgi:hypothetical protein
MAKKHAGKVIQMLSPENYIRTKARMLPIYECLVNAEWQVGGIATIIIARCHINGNITACFYMVDLFCLGVKDTYYRFNISKDEYQDAVSLSSEMAPIPISYALAHNIIYSAIEFAEEYGFKPHKNFTSTTRFMLEEDSEAIELIEIECGKDGKPLYVSSEDDSEQKINSIIRQLEKTAGIGNFEYISDDDIEKFDQDEEGEAVIKEDEYRAYPYERKKQLFLDLESRIEKLDTDDLLKLFKVSNSIMSDIADSELYKKYYSEYSQDLNFEIDGDIMSDELLGIEPGSMMISEESRNLFNLIYFGIETESSSVSKLLKGFQKLYPDIPAAYFLELHMLYHKKSSKYSTILDKYFARFPDYPLIRLLKLRQLVNTKIDATPFFNSEYSCKTLFHSRNQLHPIEITHYILFMLAVQADHDDVTRILAFEQACEELNFAEEDFPALTVMFEFTKTRVVYNHLIR